MDIPSDNDVITDNEETGEIVETVSPSSEADLGGAADFLNVEGLIKNYLTQIENLKKEQHKQRQILEDAFENDAVYREHNEKVKEANRLRLETRKQILNQPALREIREKLEEMHEQVKEQEETLSDYLLQYQKMTGTNEIEGDDGEIRIIVNIARLVKGSSKPKS